MVSRSIVEREAVKERLCNGSAVKQESLKESERVTILAFGGDDERKVGAESLCAESGAITEADFAEDNRESETLLGMIVGGFHAVDVEEGEDAVSIALWINESLPEVFSIGIVQVRAADGIECALKFRFARLGFGE